ncbi:TAXI family TRAP transporter solute-binding subunit [Dehalogenimonas etheniformans]|uniref:TAXI family TRAP transporter solute-binding subunit n=1 Tax=Dehalogenimonas etheniformans TaxID=1536648 RepID=A0A2P5P8C7_9CHLR|nr:TAXI family TRAP transporter solute-binding subunit [Dehalogenimonas etheniformans]PPD58539.1 hypothetical protein JP09_001240 [Dehalogenimonas etheniformans]QNT76697.1 hypothetical protein HX448_08380 [Dehalogenimonas etheniformans]
MNPILRKLFGGAAVLLSAVLLSGCGGNSIYNSTSPAGTAFTWPDALLFAATGDSGQAKMVSWASAMQSGLNGPLIRVVTEAAWTNTYKDMKAGKMVLSQCDKVTLADDIEAKNEYAMPDGGPWMAGMVWIDSLASTGFMVRGNSNMYKPEDIKPGTRIAIWNNQSATMSPFLSLFAWAGIDQKDIVWVNTGDYNACPRAVVEGRADIAMAAPVTPAVMEASAAPSGIRYLSMKPADNPKGAAAFLAISPMYDFSPITAGPASAIGTWAISSYKYLAADTSTDAELIYRLVKWLDENYSSYKDSYASNTNMTFQDVFSALQTTFMPVHPGLIKYLKEKGVWNADYEKRNQTNITLFQKYVTSYQDAMKQATSKGIDIKASNSVWIEFWENYKKTNAIPLLRMHVSLTQDAAITLPGGYIAPPTTTTPSPTTTAPPPTITASAIPISVDISDAHPGDDVTVTIKTTPGAEVTILFTMPNGTNSTFPTDNKKTAGADGRITWTWNINSHVPSGEATFTFTAVLNGQTSTLAVKKVI